MSEEAALSAVLGYPPSSRVADLVADLTAEQKIKWAQSMARKAVLTRCLAYSFKGRDAYELVKALEDPSFTPSLKGLLDDDDIWGGERWSVSAIKEATI
jgi:hypothetical protein